MSTSIFNINDIDNDDDNDYDDGNVYSIGIANDNIDAIVQQTLQASSSKGYL